MATIYQDTELEALKAQFEVLKKHVKVNNLVNEEMILKSVHAKTRALTARRANSLLGIAGDVFIAVMAGYAYYTGQISQTLTIVTLIWSVFCAVLNYQQYQLNIREKVLNSSLSETVQHITHWQLMNRRQNMAAVIASILWLGFLMADLWEDLAQNLDHAVIVTLIVVFALGGAVRGARKVQYVTTEMLDQLKEIQEG